MNTWPDYVKRPYDVINTHVVGQGLDATMGKWVAIRLEDGYTDETLYDTKRDAVRTKAPFERLYCFLKIPPGGVTHGPLKTFIDFNRQLYEAGAQLSDPDADLHHQMTSNLWTP